jgi:hypothetical protein
MKIFNNILVAAIILVLSGCSSSFDGSKFSENSKSRPDTGKPDSTWIFPPVQTEELPSIQPEVPGFWVEGPELNMAEYTRVVEEKKTPDSSQTENYEIKIVAGYRIQLFAGRLQSDALTIQTNIANQVSVPVFLIYEAPQYKVRLGNFPERDEAMALCRQLRRKGFPGAWVVRSQIEVRM